MMKRDPVQTVRPRWCGRDCRIVQELIYRRFIVVQLWGGEGVDVPNSNKRLGGDSA